MSIPLFVLRICTVPFEVKKVRHPFAVKRSKVFCSAGFLSEHVMTAYFMLTFENSLQALSYKRRDAALSKITRLYPSL